MKIIFSFLSICLMFGCSNSASNNQGDNASFLLAFEKDEPVKAGFIEFRDPILIDSSDWVMYPLLLDGGRTRSGSYTRGASRYWNIAFYNLETQRSRLLLDTGKILITNMLTPNLSDKIKVRGNINVSSFIIYKGVSEDYNGDNQLDFRDPHKLFISEVSGENFTAITPKNQNVIDWKFTNNSQKILVQVQIDANLNKVFDEEDQVVPLIYDFKTGVIKPVFNDSFKSKCLQNALSNWGSE